MAYSMGDGSMKKAPKKVSRKVNHGKAVSEAARAHRGGKVVSSIAKSDIGKKRTSVPKTGMTSPKGPGKAGFKQPATGFTPSNPIGPGRPGFDTSTPPTDTVSRPRSLGTHPATGQVGTLPSVRKRRKLPTRRTLAKG